MIVTNYDRSDIVSRMVGHSIDIVRCCVYEIELTFDLTYDFFVVVLTFNDNFNFNFD